MQEELQQLIARLIKDIDVEKLDKRVVSYTDYKQKYTVPKPTVVVEISLTNGKIIKVDISDYFEGVIK